MKKKDRIIDLLTPQDLKQYYTPPSPRLLRGQEGFMTISLPESEKAKIGDYISCEWRLYEVSEIQEERPHLSRKTKGCLFQKVSVVFLRTLDQADYKEMRSKGTL